MTNAIPDDAGARVDTLRQYLLGELPEEGVLRVEAEFLGNEASFQTLLAIEDELMYDYLAGQLRPASRTAFERRFLNSPGMEFKREFANALIEVSQPERSDVVEPRTAWLTLPVLRFAFAAVTMVAIGLPVWLVRQGNQLRSEIAAIEKERDTLKARGQQRPAGIPLAPVVAAFILAPGLLRGSEQTVRLRLPENAGQVRLQLDLPKRIHYDFYRALVRTTAGVAVWSQDAPASGRSVILTTPSSVLLPGDYIANLRGATAAGNFEDAADYYFTAVKR